MFASLEKFDKTHDGDVMRAYADILTCIDLKMWYNLDAAEKVPQRVFDIMVQEGEINEYSKNPEHPVFGEDVQAYESGLGAQIIAMATDLNVLVSDLIFTIQQLENEEGEKKFARVMHSRTPELLLALSIHPHFAPTLKRTFWEELITYEATILRETPSIPVVFHLERWYLDTMLPRTPYYTETVRDSIRELEMKGLIIQIASEQRFGQTFTVVLKKSHTSHSYTVSLGRKVGYEVDV